MKFGPVPTLEAIDAILAHGLVVGGRRLEKGRRLDPRDVADLLAAGIGSVTAARLEADDVGEDEAATRLGAALAGAGVEVRPAFAGRVNLHVRAAGLAAIDAATIDRLNAVDEALTVATVAAHQPVAAGGMIATVKVIPLAVPRAAVEAVAAILAERGPAVAAVPFVPRRAGLVQTRLPHTKPSVLGKTVATTSARLAEVEGRLVDHAVVAHDSAPLAAELRRMAAAGLDPLLIVGASAATDRRDVAPAAITRAGGEILHFGMPVDPGNLLVLGRIGTATVIVLPGCARSPRFNGFDLVLRRLAAGLPVGPREICGLGVGGLLGEIPSRGLPRESRAETIPPRLAAIVLAAGRSRRMGGDNKLARDFDDEPLVRRPIAAALAAGFDPVVVVTGHEAERIEGLIADLPVEIARNADHAEGLATSLRAGLAALPGDVDGVAVLLGDMPRIAARHLSRLAAAFDPRAGATIVAPVKDGVWGNPLLWGKIHFDAMRALDGDRGARGLAEARRDAVVEVEIDDEAITLDLDTPADWARAASRGDPADDLPRPVAAAE